MREVEIEAVALDRLADLLKGERAQRLADVALRARQLLQGRVVWSVNATATGGGVAEMLQALLAYSRGAGVDARWLVLDGNAEFFRITKRLHNLVHGDPGDGGDLGEEERREYERTLAANVSELRKRVRPGDIMLLHDPQTAGLVEAMREIGAHVVWRSHIGRDTANAQTDRAWRFLRPYVERAHGTVFSRQAFVPDWVDPEHLAIIPPSLDPFTAKNVDLDQVTVRATLRRAGLVDLPDDGGSIVFDRRNGDVGTVREHRNLFVAGSHLPGDARVLLQVSRWDRLKDMAGVMRAFAEHLDSFSDDVHLALVGPDVYGVTDDPEGAEVLDECLAQWGALPEATQRRVHLGALPMDDVDENAHLVNVLQRHASLVVQKSLVEGFGLTVTEPMWKGRPVVASKVGGIQDQIVDGVSGLLVEDPTDLDAFAAACASVLGDAELALRLGTAARERVRDQFLGDRHLIQYVYLFADLVDGLRIDP